MSKLLRFGKLLFFSWGANLSGIPSIPLAIAAFFVSSPALKILYASLAAALGFFGGYSVWSKEYDRAEALLKSPPISGKAWERMTTAMQECCQFIDVVCEWTDRVPIRTWNVEGGDHAETCKAWLARAGKMIVNSPNVKMHVPLSVIEEPDDFTRWCLYLQHRGFLRPSFHGESFIYGEETKHFSARVDEVWTVSTRLFMEFAAKEFEPQ